MHHDHCTSGTAAARGWALRRYRESLGLDLEDAARVIGCDKSKVSRVETGQRGIRDGELRELLT